MYGIPVNVVHKPLIAVVGETASGKSALALEIARQFNGEIIGADSWTVYRDFTIGTAKPMAEERAIVPHHLFDIVDAPDGFNAALYKKHALNAIELIEQRGAVPILVGGTGLYIDSVLFDYEFMAPGDPAERKRRSALSIEELLREAHQKDVDLSTIDIRNKRRIIRALETGGQQPAKKDLRPNTIMLGLRVERDALEQRIVARVDAMLSAGLEAEVATLVEQYGWNVEPMKGIGYAEWRDYFLGTQDLATTRARIISNTLKLAKRQRTWFKRNNSIHWVTSIEEAIDAVKTIMSKSE